MAEEECEKGISMKIALWIIAVCEVIRAVQNALQIRMIKHDSTGRDNAYAEFVKSLKNTDREFVQKMLMEFEKQDAFELKGEKHD